MFRSGRSLMVPDQPTLEQEKRQWIRGSKSGQGDLSQLRPSDAVAITGRSGAL